MAKSLTMAVAGVDDSVEKFAPLKVALLVTTGGTGGKTPGVLAAVFAHVRPPLAHTVTATVSGVKTPLEFTADVGTVPRLHTTPLPLFWQDNPWFAVAETYVEFVSVSVKTTPGTGSPVL
jgi:hypothetical protein